MTIPDDSVKKSKMGGALAATANSGAEQAGQIEKLSAETSLAGHFKQPEEHAATILQLTSHLSTSGNPEQLKVDEKKLDQAKLQKDKTELHRQPDEEIASAILELTAQTSSSTNLDLVGLGLSEKIKAPRRNESEIPSKRVLRPTVSTLSTKSASSELYSVGSTSAGSGMSSEHFQDPGLCHGSDLTQETPAGAIAVAGMSGELGASVHLQSGRLTSHPEIEPQDHPRRTPSMTGSMESHDHPPHQPSNSYAGAQGLAVATQIHEDEDRLVATMHVEIEMPREVEEKCKKRQYWPFFLCALILAILIVMPSILIPTRKEKDLTTVQPTAFPSSSPTQAPTSFPESLLSVLPEDTIASLEDETSPQFEAWHWIFEDGGNLPSYSKERFIQKFALATLYFATKGDGWTRRHSWLNHSVHECEWYQQESFALRHAWKDSLPGYMFDFSAEDVGPRCDRNGLIRHLWLDSNNLRGYLPKELFQMTTLRTVSCGYNVLSGTIATEFGLLSNLEGIHLAHMTDPGPLPTEVGLLPNLRALFVKENSLTGDVPSEIYHLTDLTTLVFKGNPKLRGSIPTEFGNLSKLSLVDYDNCDSIVGTLPSEMGKLTNLLHFFFYSMKNLGGSIPTSLGQLSSLLSLSLFEGSLTGEIPSELGLLSSAILVALRDNQFSGTIPSELGMLNLSITLNLRSNLLSGSIPTELGLLSDLREMEVRDNQLTGWIPSELGEMSQMEHLTFANNSLEGTVPMELSWLSETLHTVRLEGNPFLTGIIPEGLCNMNGTCINHFLDSCERKENQGLFVECSDVFCGCDCSCDSL